MSAVDHPDWYNSSGARCPGCGRPVECVDVTEVMSFNVGNAVKYAWRAGLKGDADEDLAKSAWYLQRERERLKRQAGTRDR